MGCVSGDLGIDFMKTLIKYILLAVAMLMYAGCSVTVIRPPSAGAFMEKSEDKFVKDVSFSLNLSDCWLDSIGCIIYVV